LEKDRRDQETCQWGRPTKIEEWSQNIAEDGPTAYKSDGLGRKPEQDQSNAQVTRNWKIENTRSHLPLEKRRGQAAEICLDIE
jgi:hypothetical protein